jgi:hypothetical protein
MLSVYRFCLITVYDWLEFFQKDLTECLSTCKTLLSNYEARYTLMAKPLSK